jgi:hypothetical protein
MIKYFACFAVLGALVAFSPAPVSAASATDSVQTSVPAVQHDEISARRYYYRPYRVYRPYRYYYRPRYYQRPVYRPYRYRYY